MNADREKISFQPYYTISKEKFAKGFALKGRNEPPLSKYGYSNVEKLLERRRPVECLDRSNSVYMRTGRDFSTVGITYSKGFVHEVEPVAKVEMRDLAWIGVLQGRYPKDKRLAIDPCPHLSDDEVVDNYWSGKGSAAPVWEWVAAEAKVIAADEVETRVRPEGSLLDIFDGLTAVPRES